MDETENHNETQEKQPEEMTFEEAMEQMEKIVGMLEENDVPLEKAIDLFQKGMALSKTCHGKLQKVEEKMDRILQEDGEMKAFFIQEDDKA
ncbi:MAG TPA: exodeoxyribonuclease VII small subunit [Bacillales bacterium]|nr:exodeoxyribonuclease VII small subunit [Bacillales bacterium]